MEWEGADGNYGKSHIDYEERTMVGPKMQAKTLAFRERDM